MLMCVGMVALVVALVGGFAWVGFAMQQGFDGLSKNLGKELGSGFDHLTSALQLGSTFIEVNME